MIRMMVAVAVAVLASATPAMAALSPVYQRLVELKAILDSTEVIDAVGVIDGIEVIVDSQVYRVTGDPCQVDVTILDVPLKEGEVPMPGPRRFTIEVGEPVCK